MFDLDAARRVWVNREFPFPSVNLGVDYESKMLGIWALPNLTRRLNWVGSKLRVMREREQTKWKFISVQLKQDHLHAHTSLSGEIARNIGYKRHLDRLHNVVELEKSLSSFLQTQNRLSSFIERHTLVVVAQGSLWKHKWYTIAANRM